MICIIPARGGSQRIYKKNVRPFFGKPIILYSIETALGLGCFSQIVVSTDCPQVIEIVRENYGLNNAVCLSKRPAKLACNEVGIREVVKYEIVRLSLTHPNPLITCLFPVAPFVSCADLEKGIEMVRHPDVDFVFVARELEVPVEKILLKDQFGLVPLFKEEFSQPSQNLSEGYFDLGQFYIAEAFKWLSPKPLITEHSRYLLWDESKGGDVDTEEDWQRLEKTWAANRQAS